MVPVFDKSTTEPKWNWKAYILKVQRRESAIALKKNLRKTTKYSNILVKENIIHACIFDTRTTETIWNLGSSNCMGKNQARKHKILEHPCQTKHRSWLHFRNPRHGTHLKRKNLPKGLHRESAWRNPFGASALTALRFSSIMIICWLPGWRNPFGTQELAS